MQAIINSIQSQSFREVVQDYFVFDPKRHLLRTIVTYTEALEITWFLKLEKTRCERIYNTWNDLFIRNDAKDRVVSIDILCSGEKTFIVNDICIGFVQNRESLENFKYNREALKYLEDTELRNAIIISPASDWSKDIYKILCNENKES